MMHGGTTDKNYTVAWLMERMDDIEWPAFQSDDMDELKLQLPEIDGARTASGPVIPQGARP